MSGSTTNDLLNEAMGLWAEVIGLQGTGEVTLKNPWSPSDLREITQELNQSRTLDPSGLTTFMLLRGQVDRYVRDRKFSAFSILTKPSSVEERLKPLRALWGLIGSEQVLSVTSKFEEQLRTAVQFYGNQEHETEFQTLLESHGLGTLRRDALLSLDRLETHQFTQGEPDPNPLKFNPQVFEFWNINSILAAMRGQKVGGITLCLIRDPEEALNSYFVFAIRNGGTLTILTDREMGPHPAYGQMTRRPDRNLEKRSGLNWFPYQLLDLEQAVTADGEVKRTYAKSRTQIVPLNTEAVPLVNLSGLETEQLIWTILVFDLIRDRFWKQGFQTAELAYTGEMVVDPAALVGHTASLVKDGHYKPLELVPLRPEEVSIETTKDQWEWKSTGFNRWMTDRYASQVDPEVLNPVGRPAKALLEAKYNPPREKGRDLQLPVRFETLSGTMFGPRETIVKDRLWVARRNQMVVVQRLADAEFEREHEAILEWYRSHVLKNREAILNAAAIGELLLPTWVARQMSSFLRAPDREAPGRIETANMLDQKVGKYGYGRYVDVQFGRDLEYCCERETSKANVFTRIRPNCPEAIAHLCGVKVSDLPWPLQHWRKDKPYVGNSILDRIDPEDWALANPWVGSRQSAGLKLEIGIAHSKSALHARRKALGLSRKEYE